MFKNIDFLNAENKKRRNESNSNRMIRNHNLFADDDIPTGQTKNFIPTPLLKQPNKYM